MARLSRVSRRGLLALPVLSGLAACGFELRREPEFAFQSLAMTGFMPGSPLAEELRRQLRQTPLQLVQDPSKAQVVLEALRDSRERSVVVSTSAGQVREWQLKLQLDYLVRTPGGEPLLPTTELRMSREMSFLESQALAKEQEETQLYRAMQYDAAAQVMRRLSSVRLR